MHVTPASYALVVALLGTVLAWAAVELYRTGLECAPGMPPRQRISVASALGSVVLAIVGAKYWLIAQYGGSVPFLDQWDAEAVRLNLPFAAGELPWHAVFEPHNEHRIALTRLWNLGLLMTNGQWDALAQMAVNAWLHAAAAAVLILVLWSQGGCRQLDVVAVLVGIPWILPLGWENTLAGFQSGFYWLVLLFFLPLGLMPGARVVEPRWWLSVALLILSLFSIASGMANALAVACALGLRWVSEPSRRTDLAPGIVVCLAIAALGLMLVPATLPPKPPASAEFLAGLMTWLSWPLQDGWEGLVVWTPLLLVLGRAVRRAGRTTPLEQSLLALGCWVLLQGMMVSYGRAMLSSARASRYTDLLLIGVIASGVAACLLVRQSHPLPRRFAVSVLMTGWVVMIGHALLVQSTDALASEAPNRGAWHDAYEVNIRQFVARDDISSLIPLRFPSELPHSDVDMLIALLRHPAIRQQLPPTTRLPLALDEADVERSAFLTDGVYPTTPKDVARPSLGSFTGRGNAQTGAFAARLGACTAGSYLGVDVAGYLGLPGTHLALVDEETGAETRLGLNAPPGARWSTAFVRCPERPVRMIASDLTPDWWFAFRAPVEYGPISLLALKLTEVWWAYLLAALALAWVAVRLSWEGAQHR